jgi:hypothetical protein
MFRQKKMEIRNVITVKLRKKKAQTEYRVKNGAKSVAGYIYMHEGDNPSF